MGRYKPDLEQNPSQPTPVCHAAATATLSTDDLLQRFWETEEVASSTTCNTPEEHVVVEHFKSTHVYLSTGKYQVTFSKKPDAPALGKSRLQAVKRFKANESSIICKGTWEKFQGVVQEYLDLRYAELVPPSQLKQHIGSTYYFPMHAVVKESSSLRVVFDASARSSSGYSLNDTLLVGPTLYPNITDVLIRFRSYPVVVSADISKMYRAVELSPPDHDLHRFVWRPDQTSELQDFRMTRVTFGVAASPYAAVQALQQTVTDFGQNYPLANSHVFQSDCLAGADSPQEVIKLQQQL